MWREDEIEAVLTLHATGLVGSVLLRRLIQTFGGPTAAAKASESELQRVAGIGPLTAKAIAAAAKESAGAKQIERAKKANIRLITAEDADYPVNLKQIVDHPIVLSVRGQISENDRLALGIVGSRRCTDYGRRQGMRFATELCKLGVCVVSGLARGVDTSAHEGALRVKGGRTIAVMGSGLLRLYPPENKELYRRIAEHGAVVSEFPLEADPVPQNFPRRNRVISGLSMGVLVVEASMKSGALITADWALEQNREVFALPGSVESPLARGCHQMIKSGAKLVESVEDIVQELAAFRPLLERIERTPTLSPIERNVLDRLNDKARSVEEICVESRLPAGAVQSALSNLATKGLAKKDGESYSKP